MPSKAKKTATRTSRASVIPMPQRGISCAAALVRKLRDKTNDTQRLRRQVVDRQIETELLRKEIRKQGLDFGRCSVQFDLDDEEKLQLLVSIENQRGSISTTKLSLNQIQLLQSLLNQHIEQR